MTIQFNYPWNGFSGIQTLATAEETRLVGLGVARYYTENMDGGPSHPEANNLEVGPTGLRKGGAALTAGEMQAVRAGVGSMGRVRGGRSACIGDSITAYGGQSWFNNFCIRSGGLVRRAINAGLAGNSTAQMVARIAADIPKSSKVETIFVQGGTNDHINGINTAATVKNVIGMALYAGAIGCDAVIVLLPPRSDTAEQRDQSAARRLAVRAAAAASDIVLIDPWINMVAADGGWLAGLATDGVHPTNITAAAAGTEAANQMRAYLRAGWNGLHAMTGVPGAVITTDDFFPDSDANGLPNAWIGYGTLVATRTTVAGAVGNNFRMTTAGLNSGGSPVADIAVHERALSGLTLASGDRIAISAKVNFSGYDSGLRFTLRANPTGGANAIALEPTGFAGDLVDGVVWAESVISGAGATALTFQATLQSTTTSPPSAGHAEISQLQVWNLTQMGLA